MRSFIFGEGQEARSPKDLAKMRALAEAMAGQNRAPQNVGEGLTSIGNALLYRSLMNKVESGEAAGKQAASSKWNGIAAALAGPSAFPPAPGGAGGAPVASKPADPNVGSTIDFARGERGNGGNPYRDAIASIESDGSGGYSAVGPTHKTLGRALGRYQIMEANIGPWSKEALGREVTADEFMADPAIQDTIFDHRFGGYVKQYGNPQDAASAWFTGQPLSKGANRSDVLGTTGAGYVDKFTAALGQGQPAPAQPPAPVQVASLDPSAGIAQATQPQVPPMPEEYAKTGLSPDAWARMNAPDAPSAPKPPLQATPPVQPRAQVAQAVLDNLPVTAGGSADAITRNPQGGPSLQMLMDAAGNEFLPEGQRGVVNALIEQQMQANDPMRQLQLQKMRRELDTPQKQWQKLDDNTLFDPASGETKIVGAPPASNGAFRFEGKSVEAQALNGLMDSKQLSVEQAQQLAAGKTISGPNGEIIFMTPQGVFGQKPGEAAQPVGRAASQQPAPQQGNIQITEPKVTLDEKKAMTFADRMTTSGGIIDGLQEVGTDRGEKLKSSVPLIGNSLVSEDFQKLDQAKRDFINAQLRRESGAVISPEEFDNANKQYFPQPGDGPEVLKQKAANRRIAIDGMQRDGGPTYKAPESLPEGATEEDIEHTMKLHNLTREQVLEKIRNAP